MSPQRGLRLFREWLGRAPVTGVLMVLLVMAGIFLQEAWPPAVLLIAAGAFLPGLLREVGLARGDEFQVEVARRSGQWAYLLGGSTLVLMTLLRPWERIPDPELAGVFVLRITLLVMILTYFLVSLVGYWGIRRAVSRLLLVFGGFWLLFVILSHLTEPVALLMESVVAVPLLVLAWLCRRYPRTSGGILTIIALVMFWSFGIWRAFTDRPDAFFVLVTLVLPVFVAGLLLLTGPPEEPEGPETTTPEPV